MQKLQESLIELTTIIIYFYQSSFKSLNIKHLAAAPSLVERILCSFASESLWDGGSCVVLCVSIDETMTLEP